jgi:acetylglutamate kinase
MVDEECRRAFARGHGLPADLRHPAVVVHGGGPQITEMLGRMASPASSAAAAGHHRRRRSTSSGMVLTGQVTPRSSGLVQPARPAGGRAWSGRTAACSPPSAPRGRSTASRSTVGLVADVVVRSTHAGPALLERGTIPVSRHPSRPTATGVGAQRQRRHRRRGARVALGACKLVVLTDVEGSTPTGPTATRWCSRSTPASWPRSSRPRRRDGAEDGRLPAGGRGRGEPGDRRRRPHPHALLLEMFTTEGTGTMVVPAPADRGEEQRMTRHRGAGPPRWSA